MLYRKFMYTADIRAVLVMTLFLAVMTFLLNSYPAAASQDANICEFLDKMTGEWVGVCDQKTDGKDSDYQYFQVSVKKTCANVYQSKFNYYIKNVKTGSPEPAGSMLIVTTLLQDGKVENKISGEGRVMFNGQPKTQKYEITESIVLAPDGTIRSAGSGKISVDGIALGLGKNGKLTDSKSIWKFSNGVFAINQEVKAKFNALCFSKSYKFTAEYSASKGSNISELMSK